MPFVPYNPFAETHVHRQNLPHWRQWGTTYFITTRLADSIPTTLAAEWRRKRDAWLQAHGIRSTEDLPRLTDDERHEYHREFTHQFHQLLDAGHGECLLARPACADLLIARLLAGHSTAYQLDAWCIMPNHLHALVEPAKNTTLGEIIRHWKGGSAHDINQALHRTGPLWQREPFDHIVRSESQLQHFRRYIAENPSAAGLREGFVIGMGNEVRQRK
jgi:putative transposase